VPQRDAFPEAAFWKEDHVTEIAEGAAIVCSAFKTMLALQPSRQAEFHSQLLSSYRAASSAGFIARMQALRK
jgi:hypothetical protein